MATQKILIGNVKGPAATADTMKMSGYVKGTSAAAVTSTDNILKAVGKLENQVETVSYTEPPELSDTPPVSGSKRPGLIGWIVAKIKALTTATNQLNSDKADTNHTHTWATITGKPSTYAPTAHTHDDRYFTEAEINSKMNNMFKVVTVSGASVAFAAGESRALTISYTSPSGYVPVGIVGFYTGNVAIRAIRVNAGRIDVINAAAQTVEFTPTITILFCKTGLI